MTFDDDIKTFLTEIKKYEITDFDHLDPRAKRAVYDLYSKVTSYADLLETNILFLQGRMPFASYHLGPIYDMDTSVLQKLHKLGIFTYDGQSNECSSDIQRPYLCGFMPEIMFTDMIKRELDADDSYIIYHVYDFKTRTRFASKNFDRYRTPGKNTISVTEGFTAFNEEGDIADATGVMADFRDYAPVLNDIMDNIVFFRIVGTEYCKGNIESYLLSTLTKTFDEAVSDYLYRTRDYVGVNTGFYANCLYSHVKTFKHLLKTNILYLQGKLPFTFYRNTPIDDMDIAALKKINKAGLLTIDTQSNACVNGTTQRPYVYGLLSTRKFASRYQPDLDASSEYQYWVYKFKHHSLRTNKNKNIKKNDTLNLNNHTNITRKKFRKQAVETFDKIFNMTCIEKNEADNLVFLLVYGNKYCDGNVESFLASI